MRITTTVIVLDALDECEATNSERLFTWIWTWTNESTLTILRPNFVSPSGHMMMAYRIMDAM